MVMTSEQRVLVQLHNCDNKNIIQTGFYVYGTAVVLIFITNVYQSDIDCKLSGNVR